MHSDLTTWLFDPAGLTAHGFCLLWEPGLIWTHAIADITIGLAYFSIPIALTVIARRRHDMVFKPVFWLFTSFILLCGAGHWLDLITLWIPIYGIETVVKAVTALVSIVTAVGLWHILPKLLAVNDALRVDITRSKENESILRAARDASDAAARAKSEFLATMSHEIRSPISGLVGVLELLRETRLDAEQSRMARMVHNSALVLLGVLNDILDFSKIENNALSIVLEPTSLRELLTDLVQPHRVAASRKGVEVTQTFGLDIPECVSMDPLRLRQILNNLVSNAIKFTVAGRVSIHLEALRNEPVPKLRFTVQDTGIGMSPDVLKRLFEPFMQADGSTTRNFGGTGLGLCISLRLAKLLNGSISVTSEAEKGSIFTLLLPLTPSSPPSNAMAVQPQRRDVTYSGRVLVADDDPTNAWLTQRQLVQLGLTVDAAENGEVAFEMLRKSRYDLLMTDCHMPRMDGVALTRAIRAVSDPILRGIPIIGITADVTAAQSEQCRAAGMSDVSIKPLSRERLSQLLFRHLPDVPGVAHDTLTAVLAPDPVQVSQTLRPSRTPVAAALPQGPGCFDDQTYRDLFSPNDPDGEAWLHGYLANAERLHEELASLLTVADDLTLDRDAVAAVAHRLVGSSLTVGATSLSTAARGMEQAALSEDRAALHERLVTSQNALFNTKRTMETFVVAFRAEASL